MAGPTTGTAQPYQGQPINVGEWINFTATTTGTLIKSGEGRLYNVTINTPTAGGTITFYDGLTTGGTAFAIITVPSSPMPVTLKYNLFFATGLYVVIATQAENVTITYC